MADYICKANGNFADNSTWAVRHSTSYAWINTNYYTDAPTTVQYSATWAGDNAVVDGIGLVFERRKGTTGTFTVVLRNTTDNTDAASVTVNMSDFTSSMADGWNWGYYFFKFGSPATMTSGKNFAVGVSASNTTQVTVFRANSTSYNWARVLRTTTEATNIAAGEVHLILGEWTAAGTVTSRTVTVPGVDNTAHGWLQIGNNGKLQFAYDANTKLSVAGAALYDGATLNVGTAANPIGASYTADFIIPTPSNGNLYFEMYGACTFTLRGTQIRDYDRCRLAATANSGTNTLTTDVTTGWKNGDDIVVAATDGTYTHHDAKTLGQDASGTTVTLPTNLSYTHLGTSPIYAEVINTKKNVRFFTNTAYLMYFYYRGSRGTVDWQWAQIRNFYASTYHNCYLGADTGSVNIQHCAFAYAPFPMNSTSCDNVHFLDNVAFAAGTTQFILPGSSGANMEIRRNWVLYTTANGGVRSSSGTAAITDNVACGCAGYAISLDCNATNGACTEFSGNIAHDTNDTGMLFANMWHTTVGDNNKSYRNTYHGINLQGIYDVTFGTLQVFENTANNAARGNLVVSSANVLGVTINSLTMYGSASLPSQNAIYNAGVDCTMKILASSITNHTNLYKQAAVAVLVQIQFANGIPTGLVVPAYTGNYFDLNDSYIKCWTATASKTWKRYGIIENDSTYYNVSPPSQKVTPLTSSKKIESGRKLLIVSSGVAKAVHAYVRKSSVAAGGADYGGNQPRLIAKANPALGVNSDTVIATMTQGLNTWESLSGNTPTTTSDGVLEIVVDLDGTTGFVNIDDWGAA